MIIDEAKIRKISKKIVVYFIYFLYLCSQKKKSKTTIAQHLSPIKHHPK